jgi:hypothetical protein
LVTYLISKRYPKEALCQKNLRLLSSFFCYAFGFLPSSPFSQSGISIPSSQRAQSPRLESSPSAISASALSLDGGAFGVCSTFFSGATASFFSTVVSIFGFAFFVELGFVFFVS